ncbi:hypothetical protein, partial [Lactiplantibacillus pentosus]|uniref:hypothetical protein n=1 Tax=Lactiplantibacillus pentosus TaxID=1589 RepID=UPI001CDAE26E
FHGVSEPADTPFLSQKAEQREPILIPATQLFSYHLSFIINWPIQISLSDGTAFIAKLRAIQWLWSSLPE